MARLSVHSWTSEGEFMKVCMHMAYMCSKLQMLGRTDSLDGKVDFKKIFKKREIGPNGDDSGLPLWVLNYNSNMRRLLIFLQ